MVLGVAASVIGFINRPSHFPVEVARVVKVDDSHRVIKLDAVVFRIDLCTALGVNGEELLYFLGEG